MYIYIIVIVNVEPYDMYYTVYKGQAACKRCHSMSSFILSRWLRCSSSDLVIERVKGPRPPSSGISSSWINSSSRLLAFSCFRFPSSEKHSRAEQITAQRRTEALAQHHLGTCSAPPTSHVAQTREMQRQAVTRARCHGVLGGTGER
jgi:hypothetical protein